jgi:predicted CXXCH cytochrome family protein
MQAAMYGATNDQVECATCHNPHDQTTFGKFLRFDNAASALCTTCHNK